MICSPLPDSIVARLNIGDCWEWTGAVSNTYGRWSGATKLGLSTYVHRLVYQLLVGPVPDGLVLDHLCRNKLCANPDHLEPVTDLENFARGVQSNGRKAKTHCPYGHQYAGENLQAVGRRTHWRRCGECHARRNREYQERKRNAL